MNLTSRAIARKYLGNPKKIVGTEELWLCPNHDDHDPSLKVNVSKDKWLCGPCAKGGGAWALAAFLGGFHRNERHQVGEWLRNVMGEGFEIGSRGKPQNLEYQRVAFYYYTDVMRSVRMEAKNPDGGKPIKKYLWERYDIKKQDWLTGGTSGPKPLYANKVFKEADQLSTVYGFEGENKCEAAGDLGLPGFSFKYLNEKEIEKLAGLEVVLWPDSDGPGLDQCKRIADMLVHSKKPRSIRIIRPPMDLPVGGDIIDAIKDCGYDLEKILKLAKAATNYPPPAKPVGKRLSTVSPKASEWVWLNRIPAGGLTMLDGDPGTNKSTLALEIAARITRGEGLPDNGIIYPPANVVICSAEDSIEHTVVPRLIAAKADRSRIIALPYLSGSAGEEYFARLPGQIDVLRKAIKQEQARLCVFDVLASYIPVELSMSRDQDVRAALSPLSSLGEETGCAFLALRHLNKAQAQNILYRGGGSIGIIGAARAGLFLATKQDQSNERILTVYKNNLGELGKSWEFSLKTGDSGAVCIDWRDESKETPESLLASAQTSREDRLMYASAVDFLRDYLSGGAMSSESCLAAGKKNGFLKDSIYRAKWTLGVDSMREGFGPGAVWHWQLPPLT